MVHETWMKKMLNKCISFDLTWPQFHVHAPSSSILFFSIEMDRDKLPFTDGRRQTSNLYFLALISIPLKCNINDVNIAVEKV